MSTATLGIADFSFGGGLGKNSRPAARAQRDSSFVAALIDSAEKQSRERARQEALAEQAAREIAQAAARAASQEASAAETVSRPAVEMSSLDMPSAVRRLRRPARLESNPLVRVWSWVNRKYTLSATRQLRVTDTVSLGDKRFVAVVHVGGQKFLIGGGAQGVSLLTKLEDEDGPRAAAAAFASEDGE